MMKIFDMHCHILPQVDDGASSIEQAINMLKMAYEDGVRGIVVTPHYHIGRVLSDINKCRQQLERLKQEIDNMGLDMDIYLGNEIYYCTDMMDYISEGKAVTMADSSYVLLEFSTSVSKSTLYKAVSDAIIEGYVPIIAHVERYAVMTNNIKECIELVNQGALLQVNADSVLGVNGTKIKKYIKKLMKKKIISFVASDAHDDEHRTPRLKECYMYVQKKFGQDYARKIFYDNQNELINDGYIG